MSSPGVAERESNMQGNPLIKSVLECPTSLFTVHRVKVRGEDTGVVSSPLDGTYKLL